MVSSQDASGLLGLQDARPARGTAGAPPELHVEQELQQRGAAHLGAEHSRG